MLMFYKFRTLVYVYTHTQQCYGQAQFQTLLNCQRMMRVNNL